MGRYDRYDEYDPRDWIEQDRAETVENLTWRFGARPSVASVLRRLRTRRGRR